MNFIRIIVHFKVTVPPNATERPLKTRTIPKPKPKPKPYANANGTTLGISPAFSVIVGKHAIACDSYTPARQAPGHNIGL